MFLYLLMMMLVQTAPVPVAPTMTRVPPTAVENQRCLTPMASEGTVNADLVVRCASVVNGEPRDCTLESGADRPVRQRTAARCLARKYHFLDAAGQPATGGPVSIPIALRVQSGGRGDPMDD